MGISEGVWFTWKGDRVYKRKPPRFMPPPASTVYPNKLGQKIFFPLAQQSPQVGLGGRWGKLEGPIWAKSFRFENGSDVYREQLGGGWARLGSKNLGSAITSRLDRLPS